jgi:FKBP-type peptidyl-prolyl cis-trans isomerase SlyD
MEIEEDATFYRVTDIAGGKVVLDANHPLAGMALRFACAIQSVRNASPQEIARGAALP